MRKTTLGQAFILFCILAPVFAADSIEQTRESSGLSFNRQDPLQGTQIRDLLRDLEHGPRGARANAGPVKVAFIGDQGRADGARATLRLIKAEGAEVVFHQGDFDYADDPEAWDSLISEVLGPSFPYFASVGNHDIKAWPGYQQKLAARLKKISGASCDGDLGALSTCRYRGLVFLLMGVDLMKDNDYPGYIRKQLAAEPSPWKICSWHIPHYLMQVGDKKNTVDWGIYEECRNAGAIIATGHEHSYSRTKLMKEFSTQQAASDANPLRLEKGRTFAFVSGLGGESIRPQKLSGNWWASVYTATQQANYGALFCTFGSPNPNAGNCYFKDIDGKVVDRFDLLSLP